MEWIRQLRTNIIMFFEIPFMMSYYYPILDLNLEKWNGTYLLWHAWVNADPKLDYLIASSKQTIVGYSLLRLFCIREKTLPCWLQLSIILYRIFLSRDLSQGVKSFEISQLLTNLFYTNDLFSDTLLQWFLRYLYINFVLFSIQSCGNSMWCK